MKRAQLRANTLYKLRHEHRIVPAVLLDPVNFWSPNPSWFSPGEFKPNPYASRVALKNNPAGYLVAVPMLVPDDARGRYEAARGMAKLPPLSVTARDGEGLAAWQAQVPWVRTWIISNSDFVEEWTFPPVQCPACRREGLELTEDGLLPYHDAMPPLRAVCAMSKAPFVGEGEEF